MDDPEGSQPESGDALFSAQNGFFQQNFQQFPEIHSQSGGLLGHQTCRSHSGQRIDFQHMNRAVIPQDKNPSGCIPSVQGSGALPGRFSAPLPEELPAAAQGRFHIHRHPYIWRGNQRTHVSARSAPGQSFGASAAFQYAACRLSSPDQRFNQYCLT